MNTVVQMDLGEILYFLIGIGWLLYSWSKKKKEKEAQHTHEEPDYNYKEKVSENTASSVLEEIMSMHSGSTESIFDEPKKEPIKENPTTNTPKFKYPDAAPAETKDTSQVLDAVDPDYFEKIKMGENVKRSTKKKEPKKPILTEPQEAPDFDLREAVINSEILNRKY